MTAQNQTGEKCKLFFYFLKNSFAVIAICISLSATAKMPVINSCLNDTMVSGIVKDINGKPIANVKVTSTVAGDIYTNSDGLFSITLQTGNIVPQSFIFSYDTLMPVVRSYHPAMENAVFEIVLEPKKCCLRDLWTGICNHTKTLQFPSVNFKTGRTNLSADIKAALKNMADELKENPELKITVTAYPSANDPKQRFSDKRLQLVTEYLVEREGISSDRINTEKKPGEGNGNAVDFKKQ